MPTRRDYLKALAGAVAVGSVVGTATAAPRYDEQHEFVDLEYDGVTDELLKFRPLLDLRNVEIRPTDVYAWKATSTEQSTDCYAYWVWYAAGQEGVSDADSHVPDREPVYVFVDEDTREVQKVGYDAYHYLYQEQRAPTLYTASDQESPSLRIVEPWHPYRPQPDTSYGELLDISSMHEVYEPWLDNEWEVHRRAVVNPWSVRSRGHWWADGTLGVFSVNGAITKTAYGIRENFGFDPLVGRET